jgi:peptidoglycan hydrolase-like protein with peptidoglycan-binding domain
VLVVGGAITGIVLAAQGGGHAAASGAKAVSTTRLHAKPAPPLRLMSVTPAAGGKAVNGTSAVTVTYNQPLPAGAPLPTVTPAVAGAWHRIGVTAVFQPATAFPAATRVTVTVPGTTGTAGHPATSSFTTGKYSTLRLQQVLAQLGYLPLTWTPAAGAATAAAGTAAAGATAMGGTAAAQASAAFAPPAGSFKWQGAGFPAQLRSFWSQGKGNALDQGAITAFEADHGLATDGSAGSKVWRALLAAAVRDQRNTHGYSYAIASKGSPETLTIWHDGRKVLSTLANTGIGVAPTTDGTYPVYEKLPFQIMQGTNPDGSHYADPVSWVSYFDGGQAVHYFPRYSFGWPQSLGCVELPYSAAKNAYPYLPYGTLVTVE